MNPNVEVAQLRARMTSIAWVHRQHPDDARLCAAGCTGRWPCDTRQLIEDAADHPPAVPYVRRCLFCGEISCRGGCTEVTARPADAPSGPLCSPQTPEQAELVQGDTPGHSEGSQGVRVRTGHGLVLDVTGGGPAQRNQAGRCICGERWPHDTPDSVGGAGATW